MSLIKWNPMGELGIYRNFDSLLNEFFSAGRSQRSSGLNWTPRVDVLEKENVYELVAELPGMEKDGIDISVKDDVLTISGEKRAAEAEESDTYFCCERHFGKFQRSFRMAESIDPGRISAEYKDGILTVSVPKIEQEEPESKKIKIK